MVDFQSPTVLENDFLSMVKFWHVVDGIFIWEFFVTLDYELSIIRGHRPYHWIIWVYSLARVCTLIAVILNMLGFDSTNSINCQLWIVFELIFAYLGFAAASFLMMARTVQIWSKNKIATIIAVSAWNTNISFLIHGISRINATWEPTQSVCTVTNPESSKMTIIATLATDVILLLTMLVGVLRLRQNCTSLALVKLLWRQGFIWYLIATVAEIAPLVFIFLNLNDPFDLMFQTPALIVMSIAATRVFRSIGVSGTVENSQAPSGCTTSSNPRRFPSAPIPLVTVHRSSDDSAPPNIGQFISYDAYSPDGQSNDKPLVLTLDKDLENGVKLS